MANQAKRSFAGGEIAPSLWARTDTAKYQTSLRKLYNFLIHRHGGISNAPGTRFVTEVKDSARTIRTLPFVFNDDQTYVLEFGQGYIRFIRDGAALNISSASAWVTATAYKVGDVVQGGSADVNPAYFICTADHTSGALTEPDELNPGGAWHDVWRNLPRDAAGLTRYEIASPYLEEHLMDMQFVQSADVITLVHQSYAPRNLSRLADTHWLLEQVQFGASIGSVANLSASGGAAGDDSFYAVTAIDGVTGEEGLPAFYTLTGFTADGANRVTVTWDPLPGASDYRVYRSLDGKNYSAISNAGSTPTDFEDTSWIDDAADISTTTQDAWVPSVDSAENDVISAGANKPANQRFSFFGLLSVTCSVQGAVTGRLQAYYSRDGEPEVLAGTIASAGLVGDGSSGGAYSETFSGSIFVPDNGYAALRLKVVPEVYGANGAVGETFTCAVDFNAVTGFKRIAWAALGSGFYDDGQAGDPLQNPPKDAKAFDGPDKWPAAVSIYQQRKLFANTTADPEEVFGSKTGAYNNFNTSSPIQDDDPVSWSLAGRRVNIVRHLLDLGKLVVFTSGSEMTVEGDQQGILRPDSINPQKFSANGSGSLRPIEVSDSAVYLQERGKIVRDIQPLKTADGFSTNDLTLYAAHLLKGHTIVDWAFALNPDSILWAVRDDGVLLGLTYMPEQEIFGWHVHSTDGVIERVCVVPEGDEDAVYLTVQRTIDGVERRYIERMASRVVTGLEDAFFVHCGLTYDGAPATTISGLEHLEGKDVSVLGDGVVLANPNRTDMDVITVASGAITLPVACSVVQVGLPYLSDVETLDIDTPSGRSVKEGRLLVSSLILMLEDSQGGIHVGQSAPTGVEPLEDLTEVTLDAGELITSDVELAAFFSSWTSSGRVFIRQVDPLPCTLLAVIPKGFM